MLEDLDLFLHRVRWPLAVRSSSLLEDSQYLPFTGVYDTFMLPNDHPATRERLAQLVAAIKRVYASTFSHRVKAYLRATPYSLEEEKMAVLLQKVVGTRHGPRYSPDFSGVARRTTSILHLRSDPKMASRRWRWGWAARSWRESGA